MAGTILQYHLLTSILSRVQTQTGNERTLSRRLLFPINGKPEAIDKSLIKKATLALISAIMSH